MTKNLLSPFLGKMVSLSIDSYVISGKLISVSSANVTTHKPPILVIKNRGVTSIVRGKFITLKLIEGRKNAK